MKIAVCDDEINIRQELIRLIREQEPDADVSAFASPEEMLRDGKDFSIVLLDISMGTGISGIDLAKIIRLRQEQRKAIRSIIIFITGYSEYMQAAFDVNAYHYLVKPIDRIKFCEVFRRAWKEAAELKEKAGRYIMVKAAGMQRKVFIQDILYIESSNKQVVIHTSEDNLPVYMKMDDLAEQLGGSFFRCHRCYLVNMEQIAAYSADTIQLVNGERLYLAKKKYPDFVKAFMRHAKEGGAINV